MVTVAAARSEQRAHEAGSVELHRPCEQSWWDFVSWAGLDELVKGRGVVTIDGVLPRTDGVVLTRTEDDVRRETDIAFAGGCGAAIQCLNDGIRTGIDPRLVQRL